ncbi:MAG: hypothetical protein C5B59_08040 [Bacteroidetes bacterium]|nr:MAG: hypothetical protein C5B59_08040 [Bacteroidota bacterium]
MNQKAALCLALLRGDKLSILTGFKELGITNIPREIGRSVERAFKVRCEKTKMEGKTRWNTPTHWFVYQLKHTEQNSEGIELMRQYVRDHVEIKEVPRDKIRKLQQLKIFVE